MYALCAIQGRKSVSPRDKKPPVPYDGQRGSWNIPSVHYGSDCSIDDLDTNTGLRDHRLGAADSQRHAEGEYQQEPERRAEKQSGYTMWADLGMYVRRRAVFRDVHRPVAAAPGAVYLFSRTDITPKWWNW